MEWYRKAAEQNYAPAQSSLGSCYGLGEGVPQNYGEALKWYRKAAEQNHLDARCSLGDSYHEGRGVKKDDVEAYAWYSLGESPARRDALVVFMSPQQVAAGKARAKLLRAQIWFKNGGKWVGAATLLLALIPVCIALRRRGSPAQAGYIADNLSTGEQVLHRASVSNGYVFLRPLFPLGVGVTVGLGVGGALHGSVGAGLGALIGGIPICIFASIPMLISGALRKATTEIALTNLRVVLKRGILRKAITETPLGRCDGLAVDQRILGHLLGYGDILVRGAGGVVARCPGIAAPKTFRSVVNDYIDNNRLAPTTTAIPAPAARTPASTPTLVNTTQNRQVQPLPITEIHFTCSNCTQHIAAPSQLAGTCVACPACGIQIAIQTTA